MKRISSLLFVIAIVLSLSACDPADFFYDFEEMKSEVESIELIQYTNPDAKKLFEKRDEVKGFAFEKMEILNKLPIEKIDAFLQDLSEIQFHMAWKHSDSPNGKCIRIIYHTGDFEILSNVKYGFAGSFDADGNVKRFIGNSSSATELEDLIKKYFET